MPPFLAAGIAGLAAGLVASAAMNAFQAVAAPLFGMTGGNGDPATVKAADTAKQATIGGRVTQKHRAEAGSIVHYTLGAALGVGYALLVAVWPPAAWGFGAAFGIAVALVLDDLAVPAFGWGAWPWVTAPTTHLYGLVSHVAFGLVLEGARRLALAGLALV